MEKKGADFNIILTFCAVTATVFLTFVKVAQYSFSGSIPPKFEHKLPCQKQRFGKIATIILLDRSNYDQGYNDIAVIIATKWCYYLFYLQQYFLALGTVLPKSFTGAFSSNSRLNVREV